MHNLAVTYDRLQQYQNSIPLFEELRRRGVPIVITYTNLAGDYGALGQFEKAREVLQEFLARNPDNAGRTGRSATCSAAGESVTRRSPSTTRRWRLTRPPWAR